VMIPNIACPACTLQIKYHPNKPTEPIFHNCADVSFQMSTYDFPKRLFGFVSRDPSEEYMSGLVEILPDGRLIDTGFFIHSFKRQNLPNLFLTNGVITHFAPNNSLFFIGDTLAVFVNAQNAANNLYSYDLDTETFNFVGTLKRSGVQWAALLSGTNMLYGVQQSLVGGNYVYTVSAITLTGIVTDIATSHQDDTFVNFFWADIDVANSLIYVLGGDENSLYTLDATLYTFNLIFGTVHSVQVNNAAYTLSNFHVDPQTGNIYAVSPGLFNSVAWTIVQINPQTGAVTAKTSIANSSLWPLYYGGGVYKGLVGNQLFHTFKWRTTGATALTVLDIPSGGILYMTDIDLGINNRRVINSIIAV